MHIVPSYGRVDKQKQGAAMGSPLSFFVANNMSKFETVWNKGKKNSFV